MKKIETLPFVRDRNSWNWLALHRIAVLMIPTLCAFYHFKWRAFGIFVLSLTVCSLTALASQKFWRKKGTVPDWSAIELAILLFLLLPPALPVWGALAASLFAIVVGRELFGGQGKNAAHPVLMGYLLLLAVFPSIAFVTASAEAFPPVWQMLFSGGRMIYGDVSRVAIVVAGLLLLRNRTYYWRMPIYYLGTLACLYWAHGESPLGEIMAGVSLLAALFYLTDTVTTPLTPNGRVITALGASVIAFYLRRSTHFILSDFYGIFIMSFLTPVIDQIFLSRRPRPLPGKKRASMVVPKKKKQQETCPV